MNGIKRVSLIIPVYFNEKNIPVSFSSIMDVLQKDGNEHEWEILFVEDGSKDNSYAELLQIHEKHPELVKVIKLTRNFGQVSAIQAGMDECSGDAVVVMSADLQDPPSLILEFVKRAEDGSEIVIGERISREDGFFATYASKVFYGLVRRIAIPSMPLGGYDYFLITKKVLDVLNGMGERNVFLQGHVLWPGYTPEFVPYQRREREIGKSKWTIARKVKYFIDGFITQTYFPLRFITVSGGVVAISGFLYAVAIVILRLLDKITVEGWAPLMVMVLVLSGVQMVMLGIIGEYMWRNYEQTRNRPPYVVEKKHGC